MEEMYIVVKPLGDRFEIIEPRHSMSLEEAGKIAAQDKSYIVKKLKLVE